MLSQKLVNLCGWNRVNSPKSIFSSFKSNLSCGPEVFLLMLLQNLSGKTSRLQKNQSEAQAANEEFVLRNHTFSSPQIVQYSAPSHPATFGQFAPFCSGMRSRKTSLKHRFRIRSGNRKRRFSPWKKMKWCNGKYKTMKKMHLVFPNERFLGGWIHNKIQTLLQKIQHQEMEIPGTVK